VFVNPDLDAVQRYVESGADVIQLHGDETAEFAVKAAKFAEVWKAIRPKNREDVLEYRGYPASRILIDSSEGGGYGGTGSKVDWDLARFAVANIGLPLILAGGLNPDNVAEAICAVRPFGIDLSSGVETSPGIKDRSRIRELFDRIGNCRQGS
jgi:phosphoribosylanthranilate isomerase